MQTKQVTPTVEVFNALMKGRVLCRGRVPAKYEFMFSWPNLVGQTFVYLEEM